MPKVIFNQIQLRFLFNKCISCLQEHFVDVVRNQEFLMLPPDEVAKLLASEDVFVPNEETIFHALVMWAKHDTVNRRKYLAKLLEHIKMPLMSPQVWSLQSSFWWLSVILQYLHCISNGDTAVSHLRIELMQSFTKSPIYFLFRFDV